FLVFGGYTSYSCIMHSYYSSYPTSVLSGALTTPGPWIRNATSGGPLGEAPAPVYGSSGGRAGLLGGSYSNVTFASPVIAWSDSLWRLDPGSMTWTSVPKSGPWPSARINASLALDAPRHRLLLFGGQDSTRAVLSDLWSMDLTAPGT